MKLHCVGLNWRAPVALRERLALDAAKIAETALAFKSKHPQAEFVVLSTCNRTEIYAGHDGELLDFDPAELFELLGERTAVRVTDFYDYLYRHQGPTVVEHLFRVAGGLDSLVLGEGQILGQVRTAYQSAVDVATAGPIFHGLFQRAVAAARRIHNETGLSRGRISIAGAAVEHLRGVFERFTDKTVLVIGGGKMAELALAHIAELKPRRLLAVNRTHERAVELAQRFGGSARPFQDLCKALIEADIVLSSTGADRPIVRAGDFAAIMKARKQRLFAAIDVAVPRDFEPSIAEFDNVLLWNLDDLEKARFVTLRAREAELDKAMAIVEAEAEAYRAGVDLKRTGPVIGMLEREYGRIMEEELDWLFPQLDGLNDRDRDKIRQFAHRMKSKFLHSPKAALRAESQTGGLQTMLDAFRKLFRLEE